MSKNKLTQGFREAFTFARNDFAKWFPGHMKKGTHQVLTSLRNVDCIIEMHDARIPLTGRNRWFENIKGLKPHLLLLNKTDLTDLSLQPKIEERLKENSTESVMWINCLKTNKSTMTNIMSEVKVLIESANRFNRSEEDHYSILIIGIPNVGKSSLINALRTCFMQKSGAVAVGAKAGVTKSVSNKVKVCRNPPIFLYDTPGIASPKIYDIMDGLKLSLCANLQDHLVGYDVIADFMLCYCNKSGNFEYVKYFNLTEPTDDIIKFLSTIARNRGMVQRRKVMGQYEMHPDLDCAAQMAVLAFRKGLLGPVMLDNDKL